MSIEIERKLRKLCSEGNTEDVREILDSFPEIINAVDDTFGRSALIISAIHNQVDVARLLLDNGARLDIVDNLGNDVSYYAKDAGNQELLERLIQTEDITKDLKTLAIPETREKLKKRSIAAKRREREILLDGRSIFKRATKVKWKSMEENMEENAKKELSI